MRALLLLSIALAACGGSRAEDAGMDDAGIEDAGMDAGTDDAGYDAGVDAARPDAGPPQFDVVIETMPGVPLEDGGTLGLYYGCQGGAHTYFSIIATGDGLDGAEVTAELYSRTNNYILTGTATGAELLSLIFMVSDSAPAGSLNGMSATLTVSVRRSDGAGVLLSRRITFVEANRCTFGCMYGMTPGRAHITNVDGPASSTGCTPEGVNLTFDFVPDGGGATDPDVLIGVALPPDCVTALGVVDGGDIAAVRDDLLPGSGTCNPRIYRLDYDYTTICEPICPAP